MKLLYPRAGEIVGVSKGAAEDFSNFLGFPLARVRVIYNPIITPGLLEKAQQTDPTCMARGRAAAGYLECWQAAPGQRFPRC